uniref:Geranylgeranyl diphosphate synthase n=1 Tax=Timspurckia oligopyrenoides TaxID=708627 RepID=A0A7S0ZLI6_9RHOD|mmetsp:Transcript_9219/g.16604  ORF Transcript_9219/g.16604 Transcript_9219/m.16604 type:complete len:387 (+) Transcript_9219:204-1364(+)|eukprot:CAMPEP_0182446222 /NCGR_PEP_ID=MMETSP1172-20130603/4065_1 /TAXON_ID=708627 /ORGANISM="Timspurckia oligopyrenoides, Strain CCMP3278" /LENGTH=386 /DNA_ID=CAMNT_0024642119 /DNA_START=151 /DNA_END=1311 /DNA_ORIENTATION=-
MAFVNGFGLNSVKHYSVEVESCATTRQYCSGNNARLYSQKCTIRSSQNADVVSASPLLSDTDLTSSSSNDHLKSSVHATDSSASNHGASRGVALVEYLKSKKIIVDKALEESVKSNMPETDLICEAMSYSLMAGGKRIRPILVLAACELFGGSESSALPSAVAVEMIHTMSLIHDDLPAMDNDDFRRGMPTNHVKYGEDIAILAGDAMLAKSFEYVARNTKDVSPERVLRVIALLAESVGAEGLVGGQVMDLQNEGNPDVTLNQLSWIHHMKTAALLRVSVAAGAIIGGANNDDVERVSEFANKIGLAFQIADDVLDVTQTTEELGKTAGKDEAVNKATYPRLLGLEKSRQEAERLIQEAKECLAPYGGRSETLLALADFIIARKN